MLRTSYFAWSFLALILGSATNEYQEAANAIHEMTRADKYQKLLRPFHRVDRVNVTVGITVVHFVGVREILEEFSLDIFIWQKWKDPRLNHSLPYSIILPGKSRDLIWLPDTFFLNIRSATFHDVMSENSKVSITPEGVVTYSSRITVTAGCAMDLTDYPLDEQICDLELSTYAYPAEELSYRWTEGTPHDVLAVKDEHLSEHALIRKEPVTDFEFYKDGTHAKLVARFWFKRRIGYALIQIYIPTIMLVVLSWLSFWIPEEAVPARVALGATTVLSVVTFTGSFRNSLPKVSYVKGVDVYFIVSFAFAFAAVLEYVLVLLQSGYKRDMSKKNDSTNQINNNQINKEQGEECNADQELQEVKVETPVAKNHRRRRIVPKSVSTVKEYVEYALIRNGASPIDRVCRYFFPCCYILFNLIYWMYYELAEFGGRVEKARS